MSDFKDAYVAWRNQSFPIGSDDDAIDELHADLVLVDTWVAESVIPFVKRGLYQPAQVDVIGEIDKLRNRAVELRRTSEEAQTQQIGAYQEYTDLLCRVYEAFLAQGRAI